MKKNLLGFGLILFAIALAAGARFISDIPNFSPMLSIALFSGFVFKRKLFAFLIPLTAQFSTDLFLGFDTSSWSVYFSFALIILLGMTINKETPIIKSYANTVIGSIIFFLLTNFSVWLLSGIYDLTISGLLLSYDLALPFYRNTLLSGLIFTSIIFIPYYFLEKSLDKKLEKIHI